MLIKKDKTGVRNLAATIGLSIVLFVAVSGLLYLGCNEILRHSGFRYSRIARGNVDVDILVAGNSRGVNLVSGRSAPPPSVFNLAYNGLGRPATIALIESFFQSGNRAKYTVIEVTALFFEGGNCDAKSYWSLFPELDAVGKRYCGDDEKQAFYFPLTRFNSELFLRATYYLSLKPGGDQDWANDYKIPPHLCGRLPLGHLEQIRGNALRAKPADIRRDIAGLKAWLVSHGYRTKLVFVVGPFFPEPAAMPAIHDVERASDEAIGKGNSLNLASALPRDCNDFADEVHANRAGRAKIYPLLTQYLAKTRP